MKINESTLVTYATSSSCPTDKEGWLWKRGEVNKNFQKRYFVLKGNLLFYFEKRYDKEPIGVIIIEGCTIELAEEEQEMCAFKIVFHGEGRRTYYLGTESQVRFENDPKKGIQLSLWTDFLQEIVEDWMKFLASASYDYMKLMVMELQQKLAEIEEMEKMQAQQQKSNCNNSATATNATGGNARSNPFNKNDTLSSQQASGSAQQRILDANCSSASSFNANSNWAQIHAKFGSRITTDRDKWCLTLLSA